MVRAAAFRSQPLFVIPGGPQAQGVCALGARPSGVLGLVVREGLTLVLLGCVIGVAGTYVAGRSLAGFLFEVHPWDATTLVGVLGVVLGVATLACLIPGRKASAEDPAGALRAD